MTNDQQEARAAVVTTPTDREIYVERVFDAPRDRVFAVITDPALIPEWWGDGTVVDEMDVRVGGEWQFSPPAARRSPASSARSRRRSGSCRRSSRRTRPAASISRPPSWRISASRRS